MQSIKTDPSSADQAASEIHHRTVWVGGLVQHLPNNKKVVLAPSQNFGTAAAAARFIGAE